MLPVAPAELAATADPVSAKVAEEAAAAAAWTTERAHIETFYRIRTLTLTEPNRNRKFCSWVRFPPLYLLHHKRETFCQTPETSEYTLACTFGILLPLPSPLFCSRVTLIRSFACLQNVLQTKQQTSSYHAKYGARRAVSGPRFTGL